NAATQLARPNSVAFGSAQTAYVADTGNNRVQHLTSSGKAGVAWQLSGSWSWKPHGIDLVAVGGSGNAFIADSSTHTVGKFSPSGTLTSAFSIGSPQTTGSPDVQG